MLRLLSFLLLFPLSALAQNIPPPMTDTVNDFAAILSPAQTSELSAALKAGRAQTGAQAVVVIMDQIADHGGADQNIIDYAKRLFNQWGIGDARRNDGLLLLINLQDRELRLALGSAYPVIWDNAAQRIIDREVLPHFRDEAYFEGIKAAIPAVYEQIVIPFNAGLPAPEAAQDPFDWEELIAAALIAFAFVFVIGKAIKRLFHKVRHKFQPCPDCHTRGLQVQTEVINPATQTAQGLALHHTSCKNCGWHREDSQAIAQLSPETESDSDSGYGGGSSSGGGASGKW